MCFLKIGTRQEEFFSHLLPLKYALCSRKANIQRGDISIDLKNPPGMKFMAVKRGYVEGREDIR
jgi:hypothetical protein